MKNHKITLRSRIIQALQAKDLVRGSDFRLSSCKTAWLHIFLCSHAAKLEISSLRAQFPRVYFVDDLEEITQHTIRRIRGKITRMSGVSNADIGLIPYNDTIRVTILGDYTSAQVQAIRTFVSQASMPENR